MRTAMLLRCSNGSLFYLHGCVKRGVPSLELSAFVVVVVVVARSFILAWIDAVSSSSF